ncbi:MAG: hypothetical protein JST87_06730 [Bacteroidetes bacterium]|nr:hypothetical protein [Bacteroidota bacterium]
MATIINISKQSFIIFIHKPSHEMKKLLISFLFVVLYACAKDTSPIPGAQIHYIDTNGNDLFANGQNGYYEDSVYVSNINGNVIPNYAGFVDWTPSTLETGPSMYTTITNKYTTLVIHLKSNINDTIKMHLTSTQLANGATLDSIWYNGQLKKAGFQPISGVTNPDIYTTLFSVVH